jgi:hypothetical protein
MGAFPMHPSPLETSLDDVFVGTFYHTRTNRPAVSSELRILHQCLSLAQVVQMLVDSFVLGKTAFKTVS